MLEKSRIVNTLTALFVVWMGHALVDIMIGFWAVYKTLAHLDLAIAGLIAGLSPFIGESAQVFFGSLGDRGYRKALLIFGLLGCAGGGLISYTENYWILFLLYLIICIGSGAFHPTAVAITSSLTQNRKGLFVTIFASGGSIGLAFSHIIFTHWYNYHDGNTLILTLPVILLCLFILFVQLPGATPQQTKAANEHGFFAMKKLFRTPELLYLYISQVCFQSIYWGAIFLLPDVLSTKGYEPWISYGGGHLCYILGGALMMIPAGYLSDLYSPKRVLLFSSAIGMVVYYIFLFSPLLSAPAVLTLLFGIGASMGLSHPVAVSFGHKMLPSHPGMVSAFLMGLVWCISESVGPGGGGVLTKLFEEDAPAKALACLGILFFVGTAVTFLLPERVTQELQFETM